MNKQMVKDSLILFAITLIAGLLLGGVYAVTKNPIAVTQEKKKQDAFREVFQDADSFSDVDGFDAETAAGVLSENGYEKDTIDEVKYAMDADGNALGYVMTVTSNEAYGGSLQIALGIRMDGTVNQISFLSLSETTGLGMEAKKPAFYEQFSEKKVDSFVYTKSGAAADNEIDALSGATITTNAVTNAVNAGIVYAASLGLESAGDAEQGGDTNE
jgi:RnfABCDGE-type electron transport complex G subunit